MAPAVALVRPTLDPNDWSQCPLVVSRTSCKGALGGCGGDHGKPLVLVLGGGLVFLRGTGDSASVGRARGGN
jgi:hypothetical protein